MRLIRRATAPAVSDRFQSSTDFLAALERLDAPNWHRQDDVFVTDNWRGCDWIVAKEKNGFVAQRRKSADYRVWLRASDLRTVFDAILDVTR